MCVFEHTGKAGEETHSKGTVATQQEETWEFNSVLKDGWGDTFSVQSILKNMGGPPTKKQFRVRHGRNVERRFRTRESKGPSQGIIQRGPRNDRNPKAPT